MSFFNLRGDKVATICCATGRIFATLRSYICIMPTVHLLVKGEVQGVFFRATAKRTAENIGITGWVKNTKDGNVEAMVSGSDPQLQKFISWCKKGPEKAIVDEVIVTEKEEAGFRGFAILR